MAIISLLREERSRTPSETVSGWRSGARYESSAGQTPDTVPSSRIVSALAYCDDSDS